MKKKDCLITKPQKREILYNLINSALAGLLVLLGNFSTGEITTKGFMFAIGAAGIVFITQFKSYWESEKKEYTSTKLFSFVN